MPTLPIPPRLERALRALDVSAGLPQEWAGAVSLEQVGLGMAASAVMAVLHLTPAPHPRRA